MNLSSIRRKPVVTFMEALTMAAFLLPGLRADLERNKALRKTTHRDIDGVGRWGLSIPEPAERLLEQYHPELYQEDKQLAAKAWRGFMLTADAEPFRVTAKI